MLPAGGIVTGDPQAAEESGRAGTQSIDTTGRDADGPADADKQAVDVRRATAVLPADQLLPYVAGTAAGQAGVVDTVVHDPVVDRFRLRHGILDAAEYAFAQLEGQAVVGNQLGGLQVAAQDIVPLWRNRTFGDVKMAVCRGHQGGQLQAGIGIIRPFAVENLEVAVRQAPHAGGCRVAAPRMAKRALIECVLVERQGEPQTDWAALGPQVDGGRDFVGAPLGGGLGRLDRRQAGSRCALWRALDDRVVSRVDNRLLRLVGDGLLAAQAACRRGISDVTGIGFAAGLGPGGGGRLGTGGRFGFLCCPGIGYEQGQSSGGRQKIATFQKTPPAEILRG